MTLTTRPHLYRQAETQVRLTVPLAVCETSAELTLLYEPDREIATRDSLHQWLQQQCTQSWNEPETFTSGITEQFYDALLPHYVTVELDIRLAEGVHQLITSERQQPNSPSKSC